MAEERFGKKPGTYTLDEMVSDMGSFSDEELRLRLAKSPYDAATEQINHYENWDGAPKDYHTINLELSKRLEKTNKTAKRSPQSIEPPQPEDLVLDAKQEFANQGTIFEGIGENGEILVIDKDGNEGSYTREDLNNHFKQKYGENYKGSFELNTPDAPLNQSPITAEDRFWLAAGNLEGNIDYLSKKFEKVKLDKKTNEILVKDKSTWYRVDADTWGAKDPWDLTKDFIQNPSKYANEAVGEAAELTAALVPAAGMAFGEAVGLGNPVMGALGAGTAKSLMTTWARAKGTYVASTEQEAQDVALETVVALGSYTLAPLARGLKSEVIEPVGMALKNKYMPGVTIDHFPTLKGGLDAIVNLSENASNAVKLTTENIMHWFTKMNPKEAKYLMDDARGVRRLVMSQKGANGVLEATDAVKNLRTKQSKILRDVVENANQGLDAKYTAAKDVYLTEAEKAGGNLQFNQRDIATSFFTPLEQADVVERVGYGANGNVIATAKEIYIKDGKFYSMRTGDALANPGWRLTDLESLLSSDIPEFARKQLKREMSHVVNKANAMYRDGRLMHGRSAAEKALELKQGLDSIYKKASKTSRFQDYKTVIDNTRNSLIGRVENSLNTAGGYVKKAYKDMNATWSENIDEVLDAVKVSDSKTGIDTFRDAILNATGSRTGHEAIYDKLIMLGGSTNKELEKEFLKHSTAISWINKYPKPYGYGVAKIARGVINGGLQTALSPVTAPVAVTRDMLGYLFGMRNFINRLDGPSRMSMIKNENLFPKMFESTVASYLKNKQTKEQIQSDTRQKLQINPETIFPVNDQQGR